MSFDYTEYEAEDGASIFAVTTTKHVVLICDTCGIIWYGKNNGSEIPEPLDVIDAHECKPSS